MVQKAGLSRLTTHRTIQATTVGQEHGLEAANNFSDTRPWALPSFRVALPDHCAGTMVSLGLTSSYNIRAPDLTR